MTGQSTAKPPDRDAQKRLNSARSAMEGTMAENDPGNLTRRTMVATCAGAAVASIADTASAQRLPTPPRTKGPLVWLDMDQQDLDEAYDQRVYAPNQPNITERRNWNSEKV